MLESGLSGSVRGVPSDGHPYRDPRPEAVFGAKVEARVRAARAMGWGIRKIAK